MDIVLYPAEILDQKMPEVDLDNPGFDPHELRDEMVDTMLSNGGIGLAANQVGKEINAFVMGDTQENSTICINPTVLQHTSDTTEDWEGCLSFPGVRVKVRRPSEILVHYYDENLEPVETKVTGYSARCYLHELDHLLGITFKDRVSDLKWERATKKADKLMKRIHRSR